MLHQTHGNAPRVGARVPRSVAAVLLLATLLGACAYDKEADLYHGYPEEVGAILRTRCATTGCHNAQSADACAGLNLETWEALFHGSRGGSAVIPYSPEMSFLLYAVNTDSAQGPILRPTMPIGEPALTPTEFQTLKDWIADGARNAGGEERFPPQGGRRTWYVANRGCDQVAAFDAASRQIMRYITVGRTSMGEWPTQLVVSPDGQSLFAVFDKYSSHIEQYRSDNLQKVRDVNLGHNGWNALCVSPDGRWGVATAEQIREVAVIDLHSGQLAGPIFPVQQDIHGPALHPGGRRLYIPQLLRSAAYVLDLDSAGQLSNYRTVDLVQGQAPQVAGNLWPYRLLFAADGSEYYVACRHSDEVRVFDGDNDSLLAVVGVGGVPVDMALAPDGRSLYVACQEDSTSPDIPDGQYGAVYVVDVVARALVTSLHTGMQPGSIDIDAAEGMALVTHRNLRGSTSGQHHATRCSGVNGYVRLIRLEDNRLVEGFKPELTVDPKALVVKP